MGNFIVSTNLDFFDENDGETSLREAIALARRLPVTH